MERIHIRAYGEEHREDCRRLWAELTQRHRDIYDDQGIGGADPGKYFDEHLEKIGPGRILVALARSKVVGFVGYMPGEDEVEVEPLIVSTSYRGKGVGTMLLDAVKDRLKDTGLKYLSVRLVARNKDAIEFFRKNGFDKVGRIELFIDLTCKDWEKGLKLFDMDFEY
ncbi:MAG: hypothetical protein A3K67_01095 [Euryarchaeota archaeon RBG_16_62_10]|nr:MAG: hypothetical protein A3K67_01095 [Euryarchaeota archaeon RBG_16_62_10]